MLALSGAGAAAGGIPLAGLALRLGADTGCYQDAGVTLCANNTTLQQWNDQSSHGNNASQATLAKKPTFLTNQVNGLPALSFDGVDDFLSLLANITLGGDVSLFAVMTSSGDNAIAGNSGSGAPQFRIGNTVNQLQSYENHHFVSSSTLGVVQGTFSLIEYEITASVVTFWQNNISYGTGAFTDVDALLINEIGTLSSGAQFLNGLLAELLIYTPSTPTPAIVRSVLKSKYALY
jgi:hypothetical protein